MNQSPEIKELFAALSKAQNAIEGAVKDSKNPHFKNVYASLESTWSAVKAPLADHGLCITQLVQETNSHYYLNTILGHISGQWISSSIPLLMQKHDMQGLGSAITYARRFGLQAILSCPSIDDDAEASVAPTFTWKFPSGRHKDLSPQELSDESLLQYWNDLSKFLNDHPEKRKDQQLNSVVIHLLAEKGARKL